MLNRRAFSTDSERQSTGDEQLLHGSPHSSLTGEALYVKRDQTQQLAAPPHRPYPPPATTAEKKFSLVPAYSALLCCPAAITTVVTSHDDARQ